MSLFEPRSGAPDRLFYDEEAQTADRATRSAQQLAGLRDVVERSFDGPVPLFARKLADVGITSPSDISSLEDLDRIPITTKDELRSSEAQYPPFGHHRSPGMPWVRLGTSTGTSGVPTMMLWTRRDLYVEYECASRGYWRQGMRPGMTVTQAHPAYTYGGGMMVQGAFEHFGALTAWVEPPSTDEIAEKAIHLWERIHPDVMFVPFSAGTFADAATRLGVDPASLKLARRRPKPAGEASTAGSPAKAKPPALAPLASAGVECMVFLGGACGKAPGGHLNEDHAIVQVIDPDTGASVPDGEWGRLVVTTIGRDSFMLRYDLEDAAMLLPDAPCACGETTRRGAWGGRYRDLLKLADRTVRLVDLEAVLRGFDELLNPTLEYQVVRPANGARQLFVRIEAASNDALLAQIATAVHTTLGVFAEIELVERASLARGAYKIDRIVEK